MFFGKKNQIDTDEEKIEDLLTRGVEDILVRESLVSRLKSGQQLRIKLGVDPTSANIHLGRAIVIRKLRDFQRLGHKVVFLVGDFTAQIGDPSDKLEKRPMLTTEKIKENLKTYREQVGKIIDLNKADFVFNSSWLSKLTFKEVAELAESFSVSQMTSRRNFKERLDKGDEVSLREFLYPIMQGYDSVALKADVELGGFDQLFNLKAGRTIQKHFGMKEQDILTTAMLEGTDGRKMSSSWGNVIAINDSAQEIFGKVMSVRDDLIEKYFVLCTDVSLEEISEIMKKVSDGGNPKDAKLRLANEITTLYQGKKEADKAEENWVKTFSEGGVPDEVQEILASVGEKFSEVVLKNNFVSSNSEWKRLVEQGGVSLDGEKITDPNMEVKSGVLKIGKKKFLKIVVE